MRRRKNKLYTPIEPAPVVVSAEQAKPVGKYSNSDRLLLWAGTLIIVLGAVYIAVLLVRHHRSGLVPTPTAEQHQRVQQSPQENTLNTVTPRSSVSNGVEASPTH